jgi:hypothetical protein
MVTRPMAVHPHQRFGIGAILIRDITLRYPNVRFHGDKLFSNGLGVVARPLPISSPLRGSLEGQSPSRGSGLHYQQMLARMHGAVQILMGRGSSPVSRTPFSGTTIPKEKLVRVEHSSLHRLNADAKQKGKRPGRPIARLLCQRFGILRESEEPSG